MNGAMTEELKAFAGFPCLIFPASRPLGKDAAEIMERLGAFLGGWDSHGAPVQGGAALLEDRFAVIAHRPMEIAGCSRDALLFFMRDMGREKGLEWVGASRIFYRDANGEVVDVDRPEFKRLAQEGVVTPDTTVFDTTLREVDPVLEGRLALAASQSWHARLMATTASA